MPGSPVVLAVLDRQGPEVRRLPEEDHAEQQPGGPRQRPGGGRPGDHHRGGAARPAPQGRLGGVPLEQHGVDHHVVGDRPEREGGREEVGRDREQCDRDHCQNEPEDQGRPGRDGVAHQRPAARAPHNLIDVAVDVAVQRVGTARGEGAAEHHHHGDEQRREAVVGQEQRRDRGNEQQLHDPGLAQRHVSADRGAHAGQLPWALCGRDRADRLTHVNRAHLGQDHLPARAGGPGTRMRLHGVVICRGGRRKGSAFYPLIRGAPARPPRREQGKMSSFGVQDAVVGRQAGAFGTHRTGNL